MDSTSLKKLRQYVAVIQDHLAAHGEDQYLSPPEGAEIRRCFHRGASVFAAVDIIRGQRRFHAAMAKPDAPRAPAPALGAGHPMPPRM